MEQFDKLNETFDVDTTQTHPKYPPWTFLKFILILIWSLVIIYWMNDGIVYISEHGLKPSIERLWEGPK